MCSKIPVLQRKPGLMATPWKYTGQLVPRAKQAGGTAALEHPARGLILYAFLLEWVGWDMGGL